MRYIRIIILLLFPIAGFAEQVTWDVSLWGKRRAFTEHVEKLSELVARKTNGEFILNLSYGGLAKPRENLEGIAAGQFEMAQFCAGYHKEKNPSITVLELPFLGVSTLDEERTISQWLYRHPAVREDFRKWNAIALMPSPLPQYNLIGVGDAPLSLMQLAGLNVRATGGIGKAMDALGANPSPIIATEVRQALETGQINAVAFAPHAHMSFGTVASANWWTTNLNPGTVNCPVVANIDAVSQLSAAHRDALYGSINEALDYYIGHYEFNMRESWGPVLDKLNIEKVTFNELELNYFRDRVEKPAAMEWINEQENNGRPGREIYSLVKIALTGENPEQALMTGATPAQVSLAPSTEEQERAKKDEILSTYAFNKKDASLAPESSADTFSNNTLPLLDTAPAIAVTEPLVAEPVSEPVLADANQVAVAGGEGLIKGGIAALFVDDRLAGQEIPANAPALAVAPKQMAEPFVDTVGDQGVNYFGVPRGEGGNAYNADPLQTLVEWDLEGVATVGSTIANLSKYIGYQLLTDDQTAKRVYALKLPPIQQKISGIPVGDAFQLLSGRGLVTVFDHTYRTVRHVPMNQQSANGLKPCPQSLDLGVRTGDGVLLLPDGSQCSY